tara:strand:+ start:314 stop:490 length:177 start_codon:yes stop_codon:yes gene_type:complete
MRQLALTQDQFDALYDLLEDTISDIDEALGELKDDDLTLDDYEIYQVWEQLNKIGGKS